MNDKLSIALLNNAADLLSEDGDNHEYDRAIIELVCTTLGFDEEERESVERVLRWLAGRSTPAQRKPYKPDDAQ